MEKIERTPMKKQDLEIRLNNFCEVALGYTEEEAITEAKRCLGCKNAPCRGGCPVNNRIPEFIKEVANGNFESAYKIISDKNSLPAVTGRVCPQEKQCELKCVRGIKGEAVAIGRLERFVADYHKNHSRSEEKFVCDKHSVAVVGGGPSGITCAVKLAENGYKVTIFEAMPHIGGILLYGIPEFCLPNEIIYDIEQRLVKRGIKIECNVAVGKAITVEGLLNGGYDAVYLAVGSNKPKFMNIPGENLRGVYSANEYLYRVNVGSGTGKSSLVSRDDRVIVVGGGNVAIDAARVAIRQAKEVTIVYRRTQNELPARMEEVHNALEEGVKFEFLTNPVAIHGDIGGRVKSVECVKMKLGDEDESGRRRPVIVEGSNFIIGADCVIMALGSNANALTECFSSSVDINKYGYASVNDDCSAKLKGVFAGGDFVCGASTVINAMEYGNRCAESIDLYLKNDKITSDVLSKTDKEE